MELENLGKGENMKRVGDFIWGLLIIGISLLLLMPQTNKVYMELYSLHPYIMGFVKFSILATMGEMLAVRISEGKWIKVKGIKEKAIVWGVIGAVVTFMFKLFPIGIQGLIDHGLLMGATGLAGTLLVGVYTSIVANFAFGPIFMSVHRISDKYIEAKVDGMKPTVSQVVDTIDWPVFFKFVVGKTIPYFWLPAHTITFILPESYRILFAAYLSIALGILLAIAKRKR